MIGSGGGSRLFQQEIRPTDTHSDFDMRASGLVTEVNYLDTPPTLTIDGDRPMPFVGNVWEYNPGDVVFYMSRGSGSVVLGKLPKRGVGTPLEDPDEAADEDPWHEVGAGGEPAFTNSWVNFAGVSDYDTAGFYIQNDYWVRLKGLVKDGTLGGTIFVLPPEYAPLTRIYCTVWTQTGAALLNIQTSGSVQHVTGGSNAALALNGVIFPTKWNSTAWTAPLESGAWNWNIGDVDGEPRIWVRDDGWVYLKGSVDGGAAPGNLFYTPERARSKWADILPAIGLGVARVDHGGGSGDRGQSRFFSVGGSTSVIVGGLNWYSDSGPAQALTNLSLLNGWANFGSDHRRAAYYRDHFNVVHLLGVITGAAKSSNIFANLPAGYRPAKRQPFISMFQGDVLGRVDVYPNGDCEAFSGLAGYCTLAMVSFRADQ